MLKRSSQADCSLIDVLYQRHAPSILAYIRRHVLSREDAEDILLEVFIAALESERPARLNEREQLAWLLRVAHNKYIDYYRRQRGTAVVSLEQVTETLFVEDEHTPEQASLRDEEHALLQTYLSALPESKQEILRLRFAYDMNSQEIARHLNSKEGTIRARLSRTLNFLRHLYEKSDEEQRHG